MQRGSSAAFHSGSNLPAAQKRPGWNCNPLDSKGFSAYHRDGSQSHPNPIPAPLRGAPIAPPGPCGAWVKSRPTPERLVSRPRGERANRAASACGNVCAVHETRRGDRLLENRCPLRAGPIEIIDRRAPCPAIISPFIAAPEPLQPDCTRPMAENA